MEKETLYEIINQGKNIAEMNAVVLFQTKLNAGMSSGMWTCEYQTTRQSLIEFTCLYSMHDPSPLDYQVCSSLGRGILLKFELKSEKERVDLWSKGASSVIVAQVYLKNFRLRLKRISKHSLNHQNIKIFEKCIVFCRRDDCKR